MTKGLFIFICSLFSLTTYASGTSFLVAPTSAEIDLKKPNTVSFVVVNNGDNRIRVSASPIFFPVGSKFMPPMESIVNEKEDRDDLSKYMVVSPKVVSLKSGERRTIRVSIRPSVELSEGEYRAHVLFSTIDIERSASVRRKKKDGDGFSMSMSFKTETGVVIYGSKGKGSSKMDAKCYLIKDKTKIKIINSGLWRFDGWLTIYDPNNRNKKLVEEKVFLTRQSKQDVLLNWVPFGDQKNIKIEWIPLDTKLERTTSTCTIS